MRFLLLALVACARPAAPPPGAAGPAEAVQELSQALQRGDTGAAWSLLSEGTRASADRLAAQARAGSDAGPSSGREMLFGNALPGKPIEVKVLSESGDSAEVQASAPDGGEQRAFHAVREAGVWHVTLPLEERDAGPGR